MVASDVRALGIVDLRALVVPGSLRPAASAAGTSGGRATWSVDASVTWRPAALRGRPATSRLTYTLLRSDAGVRVADIAASPGEPAPLWLADHLHVRARRGAFAVAPTPGDAHRLLHGLLRARRGVERFVRAGERQPTLAAVLPSDAAEFADVLGVPAGRYRGIAAATATLDGSDDPRAPVAVVLNPSVWPGLSRLGARVVLTHEATHALTGSVTSSAPLWLTEGFADYIAFGSAHVPAGRAVAAAVRRLRPAGIPRRLPADGAFGPARPDLESTYELARLAVRVIARRHGAARLDRFYSDAVADPQHLAAAWRSDLGASQAGLTRQWRRVLVRLAGAR
jgi:hypothetical protein